MWPELRTWILWTILYKARKKMLCTCHQFTERVPWSTAGGEGVRRGARQDCEWAGGLAFWQLERIPTAPLEEHKDQTSGVASSRSEKAEDTDSPVFVRHWWGAAGRGINSQASLAPSTWVSRVPKAREGPEASTGVWRKPPAASTETVKAEGTRTGLC